MNDESAKKKTSLWSPSFQGLLWTNWLTAINDNVFRWFVIGVGKHQFPVNEHSNIVMWGTVLFVAPYLFLASPAGWLADRFSKRKVIIGCKYAEIVIMTLGVLAVWFDSFYMLLATVFLMGSQSALFAPAKVGTIPELLDEKTISSGNGVFNLATLSATVIGTALGALIADATAGGTQHLYVAAITMIGVAAAGTALSYLVFTLPAANAKAKFPVTIIGETVRDIHELTTMGRLFRVALGVIFFWTVAGLSQINIDAFADESGALIESERTPLLLSLTLGVGIGSVLAGIASGGRIELGLVPWGVLGIGVFSIALLFAPEFFFVSDSLVPLIIACILLAGLGISAGFFDVPLASYLQKKSPIERRGAILSATNCLAFTGIMIASLIFGQVLRTESDPGTLSDLPKAYQVSANEKLKDQRISKWLNESEESFFEADKLQNAVPVQFPDEIDFETRRQLITNLVWNDYKRLQDDDNQQIAIAKYENLFNNEDDKRQAKMVVRIASPQPRFSARMIFLFVGLMTVPVVAYAAWRLPQKMARMFFWSLLNLFYKTKVRGLENLPESGPAILAFNHCSWLDGVTILSLQPRRTRTIAWGGNFKHPIMKWWADFTGVILISGGPKSIRRGLEEAREALRRGECVAIFPEGGITQTGQIRSVKPGLMKILEGVEDVPVIPCYIDEMWGSIFSYKNGKSLNHLPTSLRRAMSMHIGVPMHPKTKFDVFQAMQRLATESVDHRIGRFYSAPEQLVKKCKQSKSKVKIGDSTGQTETGGTALTRVLVLRRLLRKFVLDKGEQNVGILIPPSNGGAIVNFALSLDHRVAVNLNYSLSEDLINQCIKQAGIKHVLTSRKVMEKFDFNLDAEIVFLDDFKEKVTGIDKAIAAFQSYVVPATVLSSLLGLKRIKPHDLLTIIFTSGSTGVPKGVMLSQQNIATNMRAVDQAAGFGPEDTMIGVLPFFHSFGYLATLWAGVACDMRVAYHFSPLDAKQVGKLARKYDGTIMVATPTFLRSYMRRCSKEDFQALDLVVAGAERLPPELVEAFEEKFGVVPVEGYGATETSPVAAVNIPPSRQYDSFQVDNKLGTVGRPVANASCKITDLDTGKELSTNESGMIWIKGPNVMLGYLGREDLTNEVIVDGWYKTGDVGEVDEDGFIRITGRMSRFSKIGGEMVPHIKIEEILSRLCDETPDDQSDNDQPNVAVTAVPDPKKGERLIVLYTHICMSVEDLQAGLKAAGLPNIFVPSADSFLQVEQLPLLGSGKLDLKSLKQMALDSLADG